MLFLRTTTTMLLHTTLPAAPYVILLQIMSIRSGQLWMHPPADPISTSALFLRALPPLHVEEKRLTSYIPLGLI